MNIGITIVALSHGGAERVGVELADSFCGKGHDVTIFTDLTEPVAYQVSPNVNIVDFVGRKTNVIVKWLKAIRIIRRSLKKNKPDVVIGVMGLCTLISFMACIGLHVPIVMTEHNSFERPKSAPFSFMQKVFKFWINRFYQVVTVLTQADKDIIGSRLKNVVVMPNPLALEPVKDIPPKDHIVLAAGRIDGWHVKGFDLLIRAWARIVSSSKFQDSSWWLKIAGAGKQESFEYLMNLQPDGGWVFNDYHSNTKYTKEKKTSAEKQNSQKSGVWRSEKYHIEFLGFQKDIKKLYQEASIFVLSSRYEGFGLVLIEAMSQGCAPIACDFKGRQREILSPLQGDSLKVNGYSDHGIEVTENGILCEPEDVEALAEAIKKMIKDNEYREGIRANVIERSKYYSIENTMERWDALLNRVVKRRKA